MPALTAARGEGLEELRERARAMGTPLWVLGEELSLLGVEALGEGLAFRLRIRGEERTFRTRLFGPHQAENLALAAVSGKLLGAGWEAGRVRS